MALPKRIRCGSIVESLHNPCLVDTHRLHLVISTAQKEWLDSQSNALKPKSVVVRDLIDTARQGLTTSATLVKRREDPSEKGDSMSEASTSKAVPLKEEINKTKNKTAKYVFSVPPALDAVKAELLEYWREYKSGKKTRASGALLITGCQAILDQYGVTVLKDQIELACANNWQSITLKGYEQFGLSTKKGYTATQASEPNREHGTGRVFTADDFYGTTTPDNPLQGLF